MNKNKIKKIVVITIVAIYIVITILFWVLKRSSNLDGEEEVVNFPRFSMIEVFNGKWMENFSKWFNSSIPLKNDMLYLYSGIQNVRRAEPLSEDEIRLIEEEEKEKEAIRETKKSKEKKDNKKNDKKKDKKETTEKIVKRKKETTEEETTEKKKIIKNETTIEEIVTEEEIEEETEDEIEKETEEETTKRKNAKKETTTKEEETQEFEEIVESEEEVETTKRKTKVDEKASDDEFAKAGLVMYQEGNSIRLMKDVRRFVDADKTYAEVVNKYANMFPNVRMYVMMVPTQMAYYSPADKKKNAENVVSIIEGERKYIGNNVKIIDAYSVLKKRAKEKIYFSTANYWTPLGAYYVCEEFAKNAMIDYRDLSSFVKKEISNFVGEFYELVKHKLPQKISENFVIYKPTGVEYDTYQMQYTLDKNGKPTSRTDFARVNGFFKEEFEKASTAYSAYMGGNVNTTFLTIKNNTGRNLLILKDDFGNFVPSNLLYGFDTITVVDYRYYIDNFRDTIKNTNITDILIVNGVDSCIDDVMAKRLRELVK